MGENRSAPSLTLAGIYPDGDRKFTARNIYKPPCGSNHHGGGDERRPSEGAGIPVAKGEYKGYLVSVDGYMNVQLDSTEEYIDGSCTGMLGEVLIRCNNVLYIRGVDEEAAGEQMQD